MKLKKSPAPSAGIPPTAAPTPIPASLQCRCYRKWIAFLVLAGFPVKSCVVDTVLDSIDAVTQYG